jgi:hypothetical protein
VLQKKMFKVLCPIPKRDGSGKWWMRVGSGFENKDNSINVYLDAMPVRGDVTLQLRELDENDLRERDGGRRTSSPITAAPMAVTPPEQGASRDLSL